jgi:hypothetical protein
MGLKSYFLDAEAATLGQQVLDVRTSEVGDPACGDDACAGTHRSGATSV